MFFLIYFRSCTKSTINETHKLKQETAIKRGQQTTTWCHVRSSHSHPMVSIWSEGVPCFQVYNLKEIWDEDMTGVSPVEILSHIHISFKLLKNDRCPLCPQIPRWHPSRVLHSMTNRGPGGKQSPICGAGDLKNVMRLANQSTSQGQRCYCTHYLPCHPNRDHGNQNHMKLRSHWYLDATRVNSALTETIQSVSELEKKRKSRHVFCGTKLVGHVSLSLCDLPLHVPSKGFRRFQKCKTALAFFGGGKKGETLLAAQVLRSATVGIVRFPWLKEIVPEWSEFKQSWLLVPVDGSLKSHIDMEAILSGFAKYCKSYLCSVQPSLSFHHTSCLIEIPITDDENAQ